MRHQLIVLALILVVAAPVVAENLQRTGGSPSGVEATTCGNAYYDDGTSASSAWFGGGQAGDPDLMMGVIFYLSDFGFTAGQVEITGFCAGNDLDWGGLWPNEVFVYHVDGSGFTPDWNAVAQGTIYTGDGSGQYEVTLGTPVALFADFWLMNRGDPMWTGEDFNMDFDGGPSTAHSYISDDGGATLVEPVYSSYPDGVNYVLRASLQATATQPTPTPGLPGEPVPTLSGWGMIAFLMIIAGIAVLLIQRGRT
jgi:hypothetical protein